MQDVERSASSLAEDDKRQPPSTLKAALVALALIAIGAGVLLFVAPSGAPDRPFNPAPPLDHSLTDEEAIARFKEIDAYITELGRTRDTTHFDSYFTPSSPAADRLRDFVEDFRRNDAFDMSETRTDVAQVVSNRAEEVRLRVVQIWKPCFLNEDGEDVTEGPGLIEQRAIWILRLREDRWLLHDVDYTSDRVVEKKHEPCG